MKRKWLYLCGPVLAAGVAAIVFGVSPGLSDYIPTSLGQYNSSPPTLTNGQAAPLQLDVNGQLKITGTVSVSGGTGSSLVDEAAFTPASTSFTMSGGLYQTTATSNPLTSGQGGAVQLTINRAFHVNLRNLTGAETGVAALPLQVSLANTGANTNKLLVTPDSVALPANQSVNVAQVSGTTTDTNSGNKSAGTQRVVLATDQPQLTNKLLVTPDSVALPANQSVNVAQVAGTTTDTNSGSKSAGTQRVVLATDQPALTNPQPIAVLTANANAQPKICGSYVKAHITTATDTQLIAASGSNNIHICDFEFSAAGAVNFFLEKSSSGTCGSPTQIGILWTLVANQGKTAANAFDRGFATGASQQLCVNTSSTGGLDIGVYYDQY